MFLALISQFYLLNWETQNTTQYREGQKQDSQWICPQPVFCIVACPPLPTAPPSPGCQPVSLGFCNSLHPVSFLSNPASCYSWSGLTHINLLASLPDKQIIAQSETSIGAIDLPIYKLLEPEGSLTAIYFKFSVKWSLCFHIAQPPAVISRGSATWRQEPGFQRQIEPAFS